VVIEEMFQIRRMCCSNRFTKLSYKYGTAFSLFWGRLGTPGMYYSLIVHWA